MTSDEITQTVKLILATYPTQRQRMTAEDIEGMHFVWTQALQPLESAPARRAVMWLVNRSKWMPTPAELVETYELEQERDRRDASKKQLPPPELTPEQFAERQVWVDGLISQLAKTPDPKPLTCEYEPWRDEQKHAKQNVPTMTRGRTEPCGECMPCKAGSKVCARVLQLSPADEQRLRYLQKLGLVGRD